jgi:serine/threonine-protein kinase RsbW
MVERILASVSGLALSRDQTENLAVALAEALSNAVVHGHRQRHEKRVRIELTLRPRCCVVEVTDSGDGFDTRAVEDPTAPQRVLSPGGRGVYLMRRLVDRVEYNAKGNRVRLTVVRHALGRSGA